MRPDPVIITLDREYKIRPLTLGQIRAVQRALESSEHPTDINIEILRIGLERDHSDAAGKILETEVPLRELGEIVTKILQVGGMMLEQPGELPATQSTGTASTDG